VRGGGYWLLLAGVLAGLLAVVGQGLANLRFQRRVVADDPITGASPATSWEAAR
jgi:hypothetical protein